MRLFKQFSDKFNAIRIRWKKKPTQSVAIDASKPIHYLLNDMTTPGLAKSVSPPIPPIAPAFHVLKYVGGGFQRGSVEYTAAQCYVTICNVLNWFNEKHGGLRKWAATNNLMVNSHAGQDLNAFYDRRSMQFFHFCHPKVGGAIYTAESADVVAHELGHAILDIYKPEAFNVASLEVWAFHEAFADIIAVFNMLLHDEIIDLVIQQTGGNIRKANVVTNLAEHIAYAIYQLTGTHNSSYLRSAINDFKYVHPGSLPVEASDEELASECHSFGRIYLGVLYDLLTMIYESEKGHGVSSGDALRSARDLLAQRMIPTVLNAPLSTNYYEAISKTFLWVEKTKFASKYYGGMRDIFMKRNVMKPEVRMLSAPPSNSELIVKIQSERTINLSNYVLQSQSSNPLMSVDVDVPSESCYFYDENGMAMDAILGNEQELVLSTQDALNYLRTADVVGNRKQFSILDGKLSRNFFK